MFLIGDIVGTFGNKGSVKIKPSFEPDTVFLGLDFIFVESQSGEKQKFKVENSRKHKNVFVFDLGGVDNMDVAEDLAGCKVYIPSMDFIDLQDDEFFYHDLIGSTVYSDTGETLGTVDHIIKGGQFVLVIKGENNKEIMVPFVDELVPEVNIEEKTITVNLIEGLAS